MKVLVAGASGLIGTALQRELREGGHEVRTLVRRDARNVTEYRWQPARGQLPLEAVSWAEAVVSLSGAPLGRIPWTPGFRREIYHSRMRTTRTLARAIRTVTEPPRVWVSGSAVGYYGDRPGEVLTEASAPGEGFLSGVVRRWEDATAPAQEVTRVIHLRTGLVMANGGALAPLVLATRLGAGATIGKGRQHWPWVSLADQARAIVHLIDRSALAGPVNVVGPTPSTSEHLTRTLARLMRRPHLFRLPAGLMRVVVGEPAEELLLPDQHVVPDRLQADGFTYRHPTVEQALEAAL